ncbi:hypothetical protein ACIQOV_36450 [Kitasatospora sp. NPDC091257]|uniref:hypothetical protein n=1 Tax=Kitasatospora sp. NPDC091257 TaxID=3364084 RepID=UPI0037F7BD54
MTVGDDRYAYERIEMALHDRAVRRTTACGIAGLAVAADTDIVLLDIKSWDRALYRHLTGQRLDPTLDFPLADTPVPTPDQIARARAVFAAQGLHTV